MQLEFIALDKLFVSKANMRHGKKAPDVTDLLPSVRARGVLQCLLVRPNSGAAFEEAGAADGFGIVAGSRRYHAALIVADERRAAGEAVAPLPCAILAEGDDADAVEASLIENMMRLDASEVVQWETFTRLVKEGRTPAEIAATFGLTDRAVRRVLALGNLLPRIRQLYAAEAIDRATVTHLTLATKSQQRAWLALSDDEQAYCPTGHQLKAWLFGGQSVPVRHALFDVAASGLKIITDLFGEDSYFADADAFWEQQDAALAAKRQAYLDAGWADCVIVPPSEHFSSWDYEKAAKRKGGRVYLDVRNSGEVVAHEGYVSRREAARAARGESGVPAKPVRAELTATLADYVDLHRHAAVRAALTGHPGVALRLLVAHVIGGSPLFRVMPEPQATRSDEVRVSVVESRAEARFDERRRAVLAVLGFDPDTPNATGGNGDDYGVVGLFHRLLDLPDPVVLEVVTIVMGETLASGSAAVEAVGVQLDVAMADVWEADDALFSLLRDRDLLLRLVAEVAGEEVAAANQTEKTKVLKGIVRDCLDGTNGRAKVGRWVPRWMAFPPGAYTERGGVGTVARAVIATAARAAVQDDGEMPTGANADAVQPDAPEAEASPDPAMPLAA